MIYKSLQQSPRKPPSTPLNGGRRHPLFRVDTGYPSVNTGLSLENVQGGGGGWVDMSRVRPGAHKGEQHLRKGHRPSVTHTGLGTVSSTCCMTRWVAMPSASCM